MSALGGEGLDGLFNERWVIGRDQPPERQAWVAEMWSAMYIELDSSVTGPA